MPASSLTLNYDAVLSTALFNYQATLVDEISTSNSFLYYLMKMQENGYQSVESIGDRAAMRLMYELGAFDSYNSYDQLNVLPMDGITTAFFDWRQASTPITISGLEEKKTTGENSLADLLKDKTTQAIIGIKEGFSKAWLRGNGGTTITTPFTSAANGSLFIDPVPLQVKYDPTTSTVVGNINQSTNSWWQNQTFNSISTTFTGFLKELRRLNNLCSKGPGGMPNLHVCDQSSYELYEAALATAHRNPTYQKADIPFDSIGFRGNPVTWDEFIPDAQGGSATQSTTSGTWYMLNTKFFQIKYHAGTNFVPTPFIKPENQDAKTATILWLGAACVSNRRKQGVMGGIDTTIAV